MSQLSNIIVGLTILAAFACVSWLVIEPLVRWRNFPWEQVSNNDPDVAQRVWEELIKPSDGDGAEIMARISATLPHWTDVDESELGSYDDRMNQQADLDRKMKRKSGRHYVVIFDEFTELNANNFKYCSMDNYVIFPHWTDVDESEWTTMLESVDPDWTDHFLFPEQGLKFYWSDSECRKVMEEWLRDNTRMCDE